MADRVVPVDLRAVIVAWPQDAPRGAVTRFCSKAGISRSRFYEIRALAQRKGAEVAMLARRPVSTLRSPLAIPIEIEELAVGLRKELADQGLDHGPVSVRYRLQRMGLTAPAASTLARVFTRRGMVTPQPQKRPRSSYRRFQASMVHECWQLDSFEWVLADPAGEPDPNAIANVYQLLDDRCRYMIASHVGLGETAQGAITVVDKGIACFQVPHRLLTDNGTAFNQTRIGRRTQLVEHLEELGCRPITGRIGHPQTQGKDERVHATTQRWLAARPRPATLAELAALIEEFDRIYNHQRPHQALNGRTPAEALTDGPTALPPIPPDPPTPGHALPISAKTYRVDQQGVVTFHRIKINLGIEHAHTQVLVVRNGDNTAVFNTQGTMIRSQTLQHGITYYGSGRPSGYRRNKPQLSTLT